VADLLHRRQEQADEDGDDGNDHEQLDQREAGFSVHRGCLLDEDSDHFFATTVIWSASCTGRYGRSSHFITQPRTRVVFPRQSVAGSAIPRSMNFAAASDERATPRLFGSLGSSSESR